MKSLHVVTPLRTSFQVQNEVESAMDGVARTAYARGRESGLKLARRQENQALGVGFILGVAFCAVCIATVVGCFQP